MMLEDFVTFFQICHTSDAPLCKQCKHDAAERQEHKEANKEKDTADKTHTAAQCKGLLTQR